MFYSLIAAVHQQIIQDNHRGIVFRYRPDACYNCRSRRVIAANVLFSSVYLSMVCCCLSIVGVGFTASLIIISCPVDNPPVIPPALLDSKTTLPFPHASGHYLENRSYLLRQNLLRFQCPWLRQFRAFCQVGHRACQISALQDRQERLLR